VSEELTVRIDTGVEYLDVRTRTGVVRWGREIRRWKMLPFWVIR
jgi:hypothetical protein